MPASRFKLLVFFVIAILIGYYLIITTTMVSEKHPISCDELLVENLLSKEDIGTKEQYIFYGQGKEDQMMLKYFLQKDGTPLHHGTFIEIGAFDGLKFSNSKFYEDSLGWTGLLIEPHPDTFAKLQLNRPKTFTIQGAVCSRKND